MPASELSRTASAMTDALLHRGPDDGGVWVDETAGLALGHRRLSILELSPAGHQPMVSRSGRFVIAFNGEIYNHLSLREAVEATHRQVWRGHSDTETLLACIEHWGLRATLERTVGMFAFAVWDRQERKLCLARDRFGEKPLYYGWINGAFVFASELKALKAVPGGDRLAVDRVALALYVQFNYVPAPQAIYRGLFKLQPGCWMEASADARPLVSAPQPGFSNKGFRLDRYWSLSDAAAREAAPDVPVRERVERLEAVIRTAVSLQSIADVPLGAFLSGGVDSSLIVALMQRESASRIKTFTIGFDEAGYDEAVFARKVAEHLGTDHTEFYVSPEETMAVIPQLPHLYDEPFADSSQIPTFLVSRLARRQVTVSLSGDAGDELFGGYNRYSWGPGVWNKASKLPFGLRRIAGDAILKLSPTALDGLNARLSGILPNRWAVNRLGDKLHKTALAVRSARDIDDVYCSVISQWQDVGNPVMGAEELPDLSWEGNAASLQLDAAHCMMFMDTLNYLPDDILCKVDRAAMGVSLETRVPLLDHRVAEAAWQLPLDVKIRNGQGKWILRQMLYKYVPKELIERPKQGFGLPLAEWLRGPLRDWAESLLDAQRLREEGFFRPELVHRKWREHLGKGRNWEQALWSVLMFQSWLDRQSGAG